MNDVVYIAMSGLLLLVALGATCVVFVMIGVIRDLNRAQRIGPQMGPKSHEL